MALSTCADCSTAYAVGLPACPHCGSTDREGSGSVLPWLDVACSNDFCPAVGVSRRVYLRQAGPGLLEMPTLGCAKCGAVVRSLTDWRPPSLPVKEENMPKITRHGGPSNKAEREHPGHGTPSTGIEIPADGTESPEITGDGTGTALPPIEQEEGSSSPGSSSETSSEKPPTSTEPSAADRPRPARTTANRSGKGRAANSTARTTGGSGSTE